jgi:hypothetical protein
MLGMLSVEEAADKEWLCKELDCPMNKISEACEGVEAPCSMGEDRAVIRVRMEQTTMFAVEV